MPNTSLRFQYRAYLEPAGRRNLKQAMSVPGASELWRELAMTLGTRANKKETPLAGRSSYRACSSCFATNRINRDFN